jgi:hypothetical protein
LKRLFAILLSVAVILAAGLIGVPQVQAAGGEMIRWGEVKTGSYSPLHPYSLNWSGDVLDRGGISLTTLKAASSDEADIVINQYGALGANGILKLEGEKLEDPTDSSLTGFTNSVTAEKGAVYLIVLHDGKMAKIQIDLLTSSKATFSYVLEAGRTKAESGRNPEPGSNPAAEQKPATAQKPESSQPAGTSGEKPWTELWEMQAQQTYPFPLNIFLRLNSISATVSDKTGKRTEYELEKAPFLHEGASLVPLRFISEALGAKVGWRQEDQSIAIVKGEKVIVLQIGNKQAVVDGQRYELAVAPRNEGGTTFVPVRFVSEHLDMFVYYDDGAILITDTETPGLENGGFNWLSGIDLSGMPDGFLGIQNNREDSKSEDASELIGKWNLWIPGGYAPTSTITHYDGSQTIVSTYTPGAAGDWIQINADGTYEWLDLGKTYKGNWSTSGKGVIKLHGGPMDSDWTMRYEGEGQAKIFAWGLEYKASKP